jgi:uncharacterized integral membrane protein
MTDTPDRPTDRPTEPGSPAPEHDPLRGSWTSRTWTAVAGLGLLLVLLIVFIAQNTQSVALRFLGWTWHPPLAVALLAAVAGGLLIAVCAGTLRILQLRRRVRRDKRAARRRDAD